MQVKKKLVVVVEELIKKNKCPAYNRECNRCHIKGHFRQYCKTKNIRSTNEITCNEDENEDNPNEIVWAIENQAVHSIDWLVNVTINKAEIQVKVDTGSHVNILNYNEFKKLNLLSIIIQKSF